AERAMICHALDVRAALTRAVEEQHQRPALTAFFGLVILRQIKQISRDAFPLNSPFQAGGRRRSGLRHGLGFGFHGNKKRASSGSKERFLRFKFWFFWR